MTDYSVFLQDDAFAIFLFHGVIPRQNWSVRNYTSKHILVDRFTTFLRQLRSKGNAISMPEIAEAHKGKTKLPKRAFAITFDDGFENNYTLAAPILDDLSIPATIYVTTSFIESNAASWIDRIEFAFEKSGTFELKTSVPQIYRSCRTNQEKMRLLSDIRSLVKNDSTIDPYGFADEVCRQLGIENFEPDPDLDQKMSWTHIKELASNSLFTIGGHSHTHRTLSYLTKNELEYEIAHSITLLKKNTEMPIEHYSYPEGLYNCYSEEVIMTLRSHGIICSPSAEHGVNFTSDSLFHLKRIMIL